MSKLNEKKRAREDSTKQRTGRAGNPVSLAPLTFDEALTGLLETDAQAVRQLERKAAKKRAAKSKASHARR